MMLTRRVVPAFVAGVVLVLAAAGLLAAAQPSGGGLPPEKQALEEAARLHRLQAPVRDKATDAGPAAGAAGAADEWVPETGMLGAVNAPVPGSQFTTTSAWAGWLTPTTYVIVHAGGPSANVAAGAVFIERIEGAGGRISSRSAPVRSLVRAAGAGGPLTVVRVEAGVVIVATPSGRELRLRPLAAAFE